MEKENHFISKEIFIVLTECVNIPKEIISTPVLEYSSILSGVIPPEASNKIVFLLFFKILLILIFIVVLSFFNVSSYALTIYVDDDAIDENGDGSEQFPFKNIQDA